MIGSTAAAVVVLRSARIIAQKSPSGTAIREVRRAELSPVTIL